MNSSNIKILFFNFIFWANALLYGLVYFYPFNEYGEPQIPVYFKLFFDCLLVLLILSFGLKSKLDQVRTLFLLFLLCVIIIGTLHIPHTSVTDYLHFSVRNVFFYSIIFYVDIFKKVRLESFRILHEKVFRFILYFGILLFILKTAKVPNPYGFNAWFWEGNRLISTWLNPNSLGFYLLFYLFYLYFKKKRIDLDFLLIAASIFITGSLTAIIGVVLFIGYLFLIFLSTKKIKSVYLILFLTVLPFGLYFIAISGVFEYFLFKIDVLFIQKGTVHTSVSARVKNLYDLYDYMRFNNIPSIIFGDFSPNSYIRLDSQYLNLFYNYGLVGLFLYFLVQLSILKKLYMGNTYNSKALFVFCLWLFFIAFNLTAYLYRGNISIFFFIMLMYTFNVEKENISSKNEG